MAVDVQTPVFEGPFDLLLHLILREQVDLYEVPLAAIVDRYLEELERMERLNLEIATEFLLIAATLVEMKARRLLPDHGDMDLDEELALWEERDLLLARLVECKTFKGAALVLNDLHRRASRCVGRKTGPDERFAEVAPDMLEGVTPARLHAAYTKAMTPKPVPVFSISHVTAVRTTVTEAVGELIVELPRVGRTTFRALTDMFVERLEVVVRFLAVLELFKQGLIDVDQARAFGDIEIRWTGGSDPDRVDLALVDVYEVTVGDDQVAADASATDITPADDPLLLRRAVEAVVMVAEDPLDARMLAQLLDVTPRQIDEVCVQLAAEYREQERGFALSRVAGGWRFESEASMSTYVERFVVSGQSARLSAAALETLAIVAYKQPISRTQIAAIRGVSVDGVMRTLQQRGYIAELARDPGPGQAILYGTTRLFLERLGLDALDELPPLGEFVPGPDVVESLEDGLRFDESLDAVIAEPMAGIEHAPREPDVP